MTRPPNDRDAKDRPPVNCAHVLPASQSTVRTTTDKMTGTLLAAGQAAQRRHGPLDRLSARYLPTGVFRQPHQPSRRLVIWSSLPQRAAHADPAGGGQGLLGERAACAAIWPRMFNAMLIDRKDIKVHQSPVDLMLREIGDRYSLIVFPEGRRNAEAEIGEFKSGLYYLAKKRPDLELVPVHIDNLNRVLPRGEFLPVPLLSCISFGPPMWLEAGEPKADFLTPGARSRAAGSRISRHGQLKTWV